MTREKYFDDEFCSLAEKLLARFHLPSISIAIVDNGKIYARAFGLARFPSTPATPNTLYYGGSTTKAMLAAALGVVIHDPDQQKLGHQLEKPLSWDTPLRAILGDNFVLGDEYITQNLTIADALSHRTGFQGADIFYGPYIGSSPREITKRLRYLGSPNHTFRTHMQYNNYMFGAAGDALETITGKECGEAVHDLLWKPIGMDRTFWQLQDVVDSHNVDASKYMSRGYFWVNDDSSTKDDPNDEGFYVPANYPDFASVAPAGAVISSPLDYAKWIQALLDAATPNKNGGTDSKPISSTLFQELTSPRISDTFALPRQAHMGISNWGLGWHIVPTLAGPRHPMVEHSGGLMGYGTQLSILPNDSFGVITMGNAQLIANFIGSILTQELIARKLELQQPGREERLSEFNLMMEAQYVGMRHMVKLYPDLEDPNDEELQTMLKMTTPPVGKNIKLDEFIPSTDKDVKSILECFVGVYENPAYGSFRASFAVAPSPDDQNFSRGQNKFSDNISPPVYMSNAFPRDENLIRTQDAVRASTHSLRIQPIGKRVWSNFYLLHPRIVVAGDETATSNSRDPTVNETKTTWFDQESINIHGDTTIDVIPGLPSGVDGEDGDGSGRCRSELCFQSMTWVRYGAAFVTDGNGEVKMGLSLGNTAAHVDGNMEVGWEGSKVWFGRRGGGK